MNKEIFKMPDNQQVFIRDFNGGFHGTIAQFKQAFRRRVNQRINQSIEQIGRKYSDNYQGTMMHECRAINNYFQNRIISPGTITTDFLRKRYGAYFFLDLSREV